MRFITTEHAPKAIGPYSQAVIHNNILYCSGQIALDPTTMTIHGETITEQTLQVLRNINGVLTAANTDKSRVLKTTIFLSNMADYATVNTLYEEFFETHKPARSAVEVSRLPKDVLIEIEVTAVVG